MFSRIDALTMNIHSRIDFTRLRALAAFLVGLTIPLSVSISEIVTALALALVLLERPPRSAWQAIARNPVVWASLALFLMLTVGVTYSAASLHDAVHIWLKYRELLYLPFLLLLCRDKPAMRAGLAGFLLAVATIVTANMTLRLVTSHHHVYNFIGSYIIEGVLMCLASYHLAVEAIVNPKRRWLAGLAALLALLDVLFVEAGRTGYVVAIALALLLLFEAAPRKWILPGLLLVALLVGSAFLLSPTTGNRMAGIFTAIERTDGTTGGDAATESASARMRFYRHGLATILRHPVFGTGTGSFSITYNDQAAIDDHAHTSNPHNEYIMIGVQTGLVGVGLMVALFGALWFSAKRLPRVESWRGRAAALAFALSCMFNSSLLDHVDGHSFAFQIALFYFAAGTREDQRHRHDL